MYEMKPERKKKKNYAMLTTAVLAALNCPQAAGAAPAQDVQADEVVVTATKTSEEVKQVPQAVEVITSDDIERMGASDVLSALALADNLNLSRAGMTGNSVQIRGMSTNHTLILIDGRRQAGEDAGNTTNVYTLQRMNVHDIERIEIVRGPSSSLYGSDAMGGVINIITKAPEKAGGRVGAVTGTRNTSTYFRVDTGKAQNWSFSLDGSLDAVRPINRYVHEVSSRGAVTEGYNRSMYGMRRDFHLVSVYDFANPDKNQLRFDVDYKNERLRSDFADVTSASGLATNLNKREYYYNDFHGYSLEYTGRTMHSDYMLRTYFNDLKKDSHLNNERDFSQLRSPVMKNIYESLYPAYDMDHAKYQTWVMEGKDTLYLGDHHNLTFGGEYKAVTYRGTRLGGSPAGAGKAEQGRDVRTESAFVEDLWQVTPKWLLTPSVRYEHSDQFGAETTPHVGLTYAMDDHFRFKANYGRGYKAPTISELYLRMNRAMGAADVHVYGNPNLKPEKSTSFDFGLEGEQDGWFGKVTYFNNKVTNLIDSEGSTVGGVSTYQYVNINKAQVNGTEAELGKHFAPRWTFQVNHNWLDAVDKSTDARLSNRARNLTTLRLVYDDPQGWNAVLWDQIASSYHYDGQDYTYNTLNFSWNKKFANGLSIYGGVDNILNKKVDALYLDGRMWRIGAEWQW